MIESVNNVYKITKAVRRSVVSGSTVSPPIFTSSALLMQFPT